jgi:hypothetical protein
MGAYGNRPASPVIQTGSRVGKRTVPAAAAVENEEDLIQSLPQRERVMIPEPEEHNYLSNSTRLGNAVPDTVKLGTGDFSEGPPEGQAVAAEGTPAAGAQVTLPDVPEGIEKSDAGPAEKPNVTAFFNDDGTFKNQGYHGTNVKADYGIGDDTVIKLDKTGLPPAERYRTGGAAPMSQTERLARMADRLNNRLYFDPSIKTFSGTGASHGESGNWYQFPAMETEDMRQQAVDRGLREGSNRAQRELESEGRSREFGVIARAHEWAQELERKKLERAIELGADIAAFEGNESQQKLFLNMIDQMDKYIANQYERDIMGVAQKFNMTNMALENKYQEYQKYLSQGLTLDQMGYGTRLQAALMEYEQIGIGMERLQHLERLIAQNPDAMQIQLFMQETGFKGGIPNVLAQAIKNFLTAYAPAGVGTVGGYNSPDAPPVGVTK